MGPVMIDVGGDALTPDDHDVIAHPLVGGVILFARNYTSRERLSELISAIRSIKPNIVIAVDHEGGRVQRFRQGFTAIPAMGALLGLSQSASVNPVALAKACGTVIGFELAEFDIDLCLAPVLDINGVSNVIGDRGFAQQVDAIDALASGFIQGLHSMGMKSTGKHFPGHGSVVADSHIDMPIDNRNFDTIMANDLQPFQRLIQQNLLDSVMPAHVVFPQIDDQPAGFSPLWIERILRQQMGFKGVIFSDDLSMQAATVAGSAVDRTRAALLAGCDMALVCNDREAVIDVLTHLEQRFYFDSNAVSLRRTAMPNRSERYQHYQQACLMISQAQELSSC